MSEEQKRAADLTPPEPDTESMFGIDKNINIDNIDDYLDVDGVVYRDVRMVEDPADFASIGGDPDLTFMIEGFEVAPLPFLATVGNMPIGSVYDGRHLFDVEYDGETGVASAKPCYEESMQILEELFPKDKTIFIMCGAGGYADMTRSLLTYLGWDPQKIYNIGGGWGYNGQNKHYVVEHNDDGSKTVHDDGVNIANIDFDKLTPIA